jgi:hypothetical protein
LQGGEGWAHAEISSSTLEAKEETVSYDTPRRVELTGEDRHRIRRLIEEVQGRLEEISLIATRAHGLRLDDVAVRKFVPHESETRDEPVIVEVEIIEFPDGGTACLVVLSDDSSWVEIPCAS